MKSLGIYDQRVINGFLIIVSLTACFVFMVKVFYTTASDEKMVAGQVDQELLQEREIGGGKYIPRVTKWDFKIKLPVEGSSGSYHWIITGGNSTSLGEHKQVIRNFVGEIMDKQSPVRLISSEMVFNDASKLLYTDKPIYAEMGWGTVSGTGMELRWTKDKIDINADVVVELVTEEFSESMSIVDMDEDKEPDKDEGAPIEDEKGPEKKKDILVITSDTLSILGNEDKAIFDGNVFAKDSKGTIEADRMEVQNYTKAERNIDKTKSGVKTVECKGHVTIDLTDQAAKCHLAVFVASTNIITMFGAEVDGKYIQVEYWKKDPEAKGKGQQILADKVVLNRETKVATFAGNTTSTDFNPDKKSFLDFGLTGDDDNDDDTEKDKEE